MAWEFKEDRPIYVQLMEQICWAIVSGVYPEGSRLPPVRELAQQAGVNPNTMQKALGELERIGLVYTQRTAGRFITEDAAVIGGLREKIAREKAAEFFQSMRRMGWEDEETVEYVKKMVREGI